MKDGRKTRRVTSSKDFNFQFPIPRTITGENKAAAVEKYRDAVDAAMSKVEMVKPVVCAHCGGDGIFPSRDLKPAGE